MARGLHITPDMVEAAYELLRTTLPFRRWKLPHPDQLTFRVTMHRDRHAHFRAWVAKGETVREIVVSQHCATDLHKLLQDIAHEVIHLRQHMMGWSDNHGATYKRMAALVCRRHQFDPAEF